MNVRCTKISSISRILVFNWRKFLYKLGKRTCDSDFSRLLALLVSSIKYQCTLPKSLLANGQCLDRVIFCQKPFNFNDSTLKLTKYLMFPNSHFV